MTRRQALADFNRDILHGILNGDPRKLHKCDARCAWVDYIDSLNRNGAITDKQADTWAGLGWAQP